MQTLNRIVLAVVPLLLGAMIGINGERVFAQASPARTGARAPSVGVTVQLPVFRFHSVRTAVSVPDGGTINLGGVGKSSYGQSRHGRFSGYGRGGGGAASRTTVTAHIIRLRELERQWLADHALMKSQTGGVQVDGTQAVQAQADFISRHVGR